MNSFFVKIIETNDIRITDENILQLISIKNVLNVLYIKLKQTIIFTEYSKTL